MAPRQQIVITVTNSPKCKRKGQNLHRISFCATCGSSNLQVKRWMTPALRQYAMPWLKPVLLMAGVPISIARHRLDSTTQVMAEGQYWLTRSNPFGITAPDCSASPDPAWMPGVLFFYKKLPKRLCELRYHQVFMEALSKPGHGDGVHGEIKGPAQVLRIGQYDQCKIPGRYF